MEEPLLARLIFKDNLIYSVNHIFCNLFSPVNPITNNFSQCRTCRCHGIPLGDAAKNFSRLSCSVTGCNLETSDVMENSVQLGEKTILFLPSFYNSLKLLQISLPINITVTERINLAFLDEGLIMGASFVVIPSSYHVIETTPDDGDQSDLNVQLFRGLSSFLHSMNQGLICCSNCNLETMAEAPYHCYYILQPSDTGPMLMRCLAGAEEVLQVPDNQLVDSSINKEIESSVQARLLKVSLNIFLKYMVFLRWSLPATTPSNAYAHHTVNISPIHAPFGQENNSMSIVVDVADKVWWALRTYLKQMEEMWHYHLPSYCSYYFVFEDRVMNQENSFKWHGVQEGATIGVFAGYATDTVPVIHFDERKGYSF